MRCGWEPHRPAEAPGGKARFSSGAAGVAGLVRRYADGRQALQQGKAEALAGVMASWSAISVTVARGEALGRFRARRQGRRDQQGKQASAATGGCMKGLRAAERKERALCPQATLSPLSIPTARPCFVPSRDGGRGSPASQANRRFAPGSRHEKSIPMGARDARHPGRHLLVSGARTHRTYPDAFCDGAGNVSKGSGLCGVFGGATPLQSPAQASGQPEPAYRRPENPAAVPRQRIGTPVCLALASGST